MGYFGVKRGDNPVNKVFVKKFWKKFFGNMTPISKSG